ncbi:MAG: hypothetical protein LC745_07390 [Planctomycetia bacterium]|nr:hypothetical protein [Planctomycetia bacterium]
MVTLNCPLCGSTVRAPSDRPNEQLSCKKCHSPFYLDRNRNAVVGVPPGVERDVDEIKQKVKEKLEGFPVKQAVGGLALLLVVGAALSYLLRPADPLQPAALKAAQAFADDKLDDLKAMAAPGTEADLTRWFNDSRPQFLSLRERWQGKPEVVEVGIAAEDKERRVGATSFAVHPGTGNARDVSLTGPGEMLAGAIAGFDGAMNWTLSPRGHWEIDGRATYQTLHPATATTANTPAPRK